VTRSDRRKPLFYISKIKKQTIKSNFVFMFLLCLVAVLLISITYIITHADHEHDHNGIDGDCEVCAKIQTTENLLKSIKMTARGSASLFILLFAATAILFSVSCSIENTTLVGLKIRNNN
jgi:hypothetical protein